MKTVSEREQSISKTKGKDNMRRFLAIAGILIFAACCVCNYAHADLKTLMRIGKNQKEMAKALKNETANYNSVKEAILKEKLQEGMDGDQVRSKYGDPVIDIFDKRRNVNKWLYMPQTSSHFEGEKLYLYIDEGNKLVGWQIIEQ